MNPSQPIYLILLNGWFRYPRFCSKRSPCHRNDGIAGTIDDTSPLVVICCWTSNVQLLPK